jgi:asparagine synthase (glutamine-hydrolysing)
MCGIVAVLARRGSPSREKVEAALRAVAHRGPDGRAVFMAGPVALAHARLAITGGDSGAQPIVRDHLVLVANGELYGHAEERARLERAGRRFATRSDSELAIALYEEVGLDAFARLRGEFALALWDGREERLVCARDRFGVRPLYYAEHEGSLLVASSVRALFALGVPRAWDEDALHQVLSMQYARPGETLFRGIRSLRPGSRLVADRAGVTVEPYAEVSFAASPEPLDEGEAIARFRELLRDAVRERLEAEVPVALQLSGGLDSSAVVALAAERQRDLTCLTVSFREDGPSELDELEHARCVAEHVGARHEVVVVESGDVLGALGEAVERAEGPAINAHLPAKWLLAKRARELGFRVLLTGEGADELLAGYAHFRADLGGTPAPPIPMGSLAGLHLPSGDALPTDSVREALGFVPTWMRAKATLGQRVRRFLAPEWCAAHQSCAFERALEAVPTGRILRGRGRVEQAQTLWTIFSLGGYILPVVGDGAEMAHAVEGRPPFLDPRLWDEVARWPTALRIRSEAEKHALREALRGILPEATRVRPKHPFLGPAIFATANRAARAYLRETLEAADLPFLDRTAPERISRAIDAASPEERRALDPAIFLLVTLALLGERVLSGSSA